MHAMGWLNLEKTLEVANSQLTHQLVNYKIPEMLSHKFDKDPPDLKGKPNKKKTQFWKSRVTKTHYRYQAYKIYQNIPESITKIKIKPKLFKKWMKRYQKKCTGYTKRQKKLRKM